MPRPLKIGQLARATGFSTRTLRYYDGLGLLPPPGRSESGYRLYGAAEIERCTFIKKAKELGLSLEEIRDILTLHAQQAPVCVHVLALLDQKIELVDRLVREMREFRGELARLREESAHRFEAHPQDVAICGIVERGIHARGEMALAWLESHRKQ